MFEFVQQSRCKTSTFHLVKKMSDLKELVGATVEEALYSLGGLELIFSKDNKKYKLMQYEGEIYFGEYLGHILETQ